MIDPILKQQWLNALRSGKYKKGRAALKRVGPDGDVCHCALGVLAEVHPDMYFEDTPNVYGDSLLYDLHGTHVYPADKRTGYNPLFAVLGTQLVEDTWRTNDRGEFANDPDFIRMADWVEENVPVS